PSARRRVRRAGRRARRVGRRARLVGRRPLGVAVTAPVALGDGASGNASPGIGRGVPATLVRLKVRLIANRARSAKGGVAQLAVAVAYSLLVGGTGALLAVAAGYARDQQVSRDAIVLGSTAILLGWAILPLLSFGADESLDPNRLILFPLRRGPLMRGLLLSAFVGPAPGAVILIVVGAVIGYSRGIGAVI